VEGIKEILNTFIFTYAVGGEGGEQDDGDEEEESSSEEDFILPPRALPSAMRDDKSPILVELMMSSTAASFNAPSAPTIRKLEAVLVSSVPGVDCPLKCNKGVCTNESLDDLGYRCLCPMGMKGTFCDVRKCPLLHQVHEFSIWPVRRKALYYAQHLANFRFDDSAQELVVTGVMHH
jgi:hypothetical protein